MLSGDLRLTEYIPRISDYKKKGLGHLGASENDEKIIKKLMD